MYFMSVLSYALFIAVSFSIFSLIPAFRTRAFHPVEQMAPLVSTGHVQALPRKYIVHLKTEDPLDDVSSSSYFGTSSAKSMQQRHRLWLLEKLADASSNSKIEHTYDFEHFVGYAGEFDDALLHEIRQDPAVELVEKDQPVWALDHQFLLNPETKELFDAPTDDDYGDSPIVADPMDFAKRIAEEIFETLMGSKRAATSATTTSTATATTAASLKASRYPLKRRPHAPIFGATPAQKLAYQRSKGVRQPNILAADALENCLTQKNAPWGLSRVSNRDLPEVNGGSYTYPASAGTGVNVYIIDTGIFVDHEEFEGRAKWGVTIPQFDMDIDGNGHGTHCAGIVGSKTYGVAKNATLIAVKVLRTNGFGSNADVIKGVEWVLNQHRVYGKRGQRSVINMSLGGGKSLALERAVDATVEAGVHFAVAAGNDATDACEYSPAGSERAITVGASTIRDGVAYFSNHGACVDIFAPGLDITSTWIGSKAAVNTISGTSMASPHVAGVAALYLGVKDYTPNELKQLLKDHSVNDILSDMPFGTANRLVNIDSLIKSVNAPNAH